MPNAINPKSINHPNIVVEDSAASLAHFRDLYGAVFLMDVPVETCRAVLIEIGGVVFELFSPQEYLLNARQGAHFLGLEYIVDVGEARAVAAAHGVRLLKDYGFVLHTHPEDGFGVSFEFYDRSFYGSDSPIPALKPVGYWWDEHPLGLGGLKAYTVAVPDAGAAVQFYEKFFGAERHYEQERSELAARAIGLKVGGSIVEILEPRGRGPLQDDLYRIGRGMRSVVFKTKNLEQARNYFVQRGVGVVLGSAPDRFAVDPKASQGVLFEFSE